MSDIESNSQNKCQNELLDKECLHHCVICDKLYTSSSNLYKHVREKHKENLRFKLNPTYVCPLCHNSDSSKTDFHAHLSTSHNISLETDNHQFNSIEEFTSWKEDIEKKTQTLYVKKTGNHRRGGAELIRYSCHRSGNFKHKGANIRRHKSSVRMNANCPAEILLLREENSFSVTFTKTHVGHSTVLNIESRKCPPLICTICNNTLRGHCKYNSHLSVAHNITLEKENLEFNSVEEFNFWKSDIESKTYSTFVKKSYIHKKQTGVEYIRYVCHKSIKSIPNEENACESGNLQKHAHCPAQIYTVINQNSVSVEFVKTHIGHLSDVGSIQSTEECLAVTELTAMYHGTSKNEEHFSSNCQELFSRTMNVGENINDIIPEEFRTNEDYNSTFAHAEHENISFTDGDPNSTSVSMDYHYAMTDDVNSENIEARNHRPSKEKKLVAEYYILVQKIYA